ncbi:MAG: tetratricopeptide repeat protein [Bifidobacteriaceae bacterium]|jgi:putative thioredoxin|nr:tetratricopeptide repeat protein [Bifidobacteriaceae bacterium]
MSDRFADSKMPDLAKPAAGAAGAVVAVDGEEAFRQLVEQSSRVPVVLYFWASWSEASQTMLGVVSQAANESGGRLLLATIDVGANQAIAAALTVQTLPAAVAVVGGEPVELFQGPLTAEQVRALFDQLLKAAATVGVTGTVTGAEPEPPPLPPLHRAGYDALEAGDLAAAKAAFSQALAESPADREAKAALAQVELLERTDQAGQTDVDGLLKAAAAPGATVDQVLTAADAAVAAGRSAEGFAVVLQAMRGASPEAKDELRLRLLSLFEVAGEADPAVGAARRQLSAVLF